MTSGRSLETLTAADFRDIKGSAFRVTVELPEPGRYATLEVELADVTEFAGQSAGHRSGPSRLPFSVLFRGPLRPVLPQGIYRLENDQLGALDLFIVPIGPDEKTGPDELPTTAMRYEEVFS